MANLTQRDHHWRKCHAPGVEQVEILYCSSKNGQQVANLTPRGKTITGRSAKLLEMNM